MQAVGLHQHASQRVPLPSPPASSLPAFADPESDSLRAASPTVMRFLATAVTDPSFESAPASALVTELVDFPPHCRLDYAASLVAESASVCPLSVGGTYVNEVPPPGANIISGMWIFRGVDYFQTFSPTPKMTTLRVLLHVAAQRDYELHSLDFSIAFLHGSLHEEIWLRRPPGFTGTTLAALGFAPSTTDPSLFLRTDTLLLPFYILVYVDDLVFATADTAGLAIVKSFSASTSQLSGPYPELVVCLQRGQLRLAYVASLANTADIFTKALQPCDH
ncbi:unnamed protein product [Closterium sp. NIES-53]